MTQQITIVDIQFKRSEDREELNRLVEELRKSQRATNSLIREVQDLQARVAALEAAP